MFRTVTLRGPKGSIAWSYMEAAELTGWIVVRPRDSVEWSLRARVVKSDSHRLKQTPLLFTAPRMMKPRGLWTFPIVPSSIRIAGSTLTAKLQQPIGW